MRYIVLLLVLLQTSVAHALVSVGPSPNGYVIPTKQLVRPAGQVLEFGGRPVDMALSPDGSALYAKTNRSLLAVDAKSWKIRKELPYEAGANSMHGIAVSRDGSHVYVTTVPDQLLQADVGEDGTVTWGRKIILPGPGGKDRSTPCGIAVSPDGASALVCLSRNNSLGLVDLTLGRLVKEIPVGVAPYEVILSADGTIAYVSNWGGRQARAGERTAGSSGTPALVDERGVGCSGTVSVVDLKEGNEEAEIITGLHPSGMVMSADGRTLYVANANSDTVSVINVKAKQVTDTIEVRPVSSLPFGSAPNSLALSKDGKELYVANGGNNAVAVVSLGRQNAINGFIPAGWYPGALATDGMNLYIANVKGFRSRNKPKDAHGWSVYWALGCLNKVAIPDSTTLERYTAQVKSDARLPQVLRAMEKAQSGVKPVPVPSNVGEPSTIEHVVYVIKENRTYDQLFGDMPRGNNDPSLCVFGKEVTPNHHALAEQFALLDNFYCNGVVSADGHQWATQGYTTDYIEKQFGGWGRSYPYEGDDALAFASSGFIWDNVLLHGLSFRNYGEMGAGRTDPKDLSYEDIEKGKAELSSEYRVETLKSYSCPDYPGWNMRIPDSARAGSFLREFRDYERKGEWPDFTIVYLPNDHTSGASPGLPTPKGYLAANDLALGQIVEAISKSQFWPKTCIFVVEDDPQAGFDHVDGHRSICLVISPYTKHGKVVSEFYNQTSVLHTMELILGIPPMNQMDAMAPVMSDCFTSTPDLRPYTCLPNLIPLDQTNPTTVGLDGRRLEMANQTLSMRFDQPDRIDDDTLNRIIWNSAKGVHSPYPAEWAGAHGRGLKALKLRLDGETDDG
ncbi:MAG TPA: bifunctional YncE family protein/alkaline phosphatase family protein [Armatimonadota bacterium]|nr:bifunctional YncE family protein/alkaline phosphatase family protein [Armatimonadota bacterium]